MGMELTKEFVNSCRKVGVLRDFLCQAIDQVDEKDAEISKLKEQYKDMDIAHTVHIAKMNAKIEELESNERRLKRALWLNRADKYKRSEMLAIEGACLKSYEDWNRFLARKRTYEKWVDQLIDIAKLCEKLESKCRAMAEKFK